MKIYILFLFILFTPVLAKAQAGESIPAEQGWRLAAQAWTFHYFTFAEALDKMNAAGIKYVEMYPDQQIGAGIDGKTDFRMPKEKQEQLKQLIQSKGLKLVNYGVVSGKDEAEWVTMMEFAKNMGIETIITEADSLQLNYIEPLCEEYQINVALHNHPEPTLYGAASIYWEPTYTMQQVAKRGKYIGLCPDVGHWLRSGINPLEGLGIYKGKIMAVHAKDLIPDPNGFCGFHDVPWGTGLNNLSGVFHELKNQGYKGTITLEYEYHWENSLEEVKSCVDYYSRLMDWMTKE